MSTLKDISRAVGLSVATVSRALNGYPEVSARTRALVEEAARALNYRPNRLAQKLQSGRSGLVGMIVRPDPKAPADRGFVEIMLGLSEELAKHDLDLVFQVALGVDPVEPYRRLVEKGTVDGFLLNAPMVDDPRIAYLLKVGMPFVVHGRAGGTVDYPSYDLDNRGVARAAVLFLGDLGHRRITLLNGLAHRNYAAERLAGFRAAMRDIGADTGAKTGADTGAKTGAKIGEQTSDAIHSDAIHSDDGAPDFGYRAGLALLSGRSGPVPTAVICATTEMADGVFRAARDLQVSIPKDLSVIAHDDEVPDLRATNFSPTLTVTSAPLRDACAPLTRALIAALDTTAPSVLQETATAVLIPRGSTGPVPSVA